MYKFVMPRLNAIKIYVKNGIYHVYNRGVDKMPIFLSENDYFLFIEIIVQMLSPKRSSRFKIKDYSKRVRLLAFCLMENHFHLLIEQLDETAMAEFIQTLCICYCMRLNKRNRRIGHLFQDKYQARLIKDDHDLMTISYYIHMNPSKDPNDSLAYPYSSIRCYTQRNHKSWDFVKTSCVLALFDYKPCNYKEFIMQSPGLLVKVQDLVYTTSCYGKEKRKQNINNTRMR